MVSAACLNKINSSLLFSSPYPPPTMTMFLVPQDDGGSDDSAVQGLQKMGYQPELTRVRDGLPLRADSFWYILLNVVSRAIPHFIQCVFNLSTILFLVSSQVPSYLVTLGTLGFFNWCMIRLTWSSGGKCLAIMAVREFYFSPWGSYTSYLCQSIRTFGPHSHIFDWWRTCNHDLGVCVLLFISALLFWASSNLTGVIVGYWFQ